MWFLLYFQLASFEPEKIVGPFLPSPGTRSISINRVAQVVMI